MLGGRNNAHQQHGPLPLLLLLAVELPPQEVILFHHLLITVLLLQQQSIPPGLNQHACLQLLSHNGQLLHGQWWLATVLYHSCGSLTCSLEVPEVLSIWSGSGPQDSPLFRHFWLLFSPSLLTTHMAQDFKFSHHGLELQPWRSPHPQQTRRTQLLSLLLLQEHPGIIPNQTRNTSSGRTQTQLP